MVCPRWWASSAMAVPIRPWPIMARRKVATSRRSSTSEKLPMQSAHHVGSVLFPDDERHVDGRCSLGDDLDVGRPYRVEHAPRQARSLPKANPDDGDNGSLLLDPDFAQLAEVTHQWIEPGTILDRKGD